VSTLLDGQVTTAENIVTFVVSSFTENIVTFVVSSFTEISFLKKNAPTFD
jgi:hypothetical protein